MKSIEVGAALRPLIGLAFIGSRRAVDMEMFWFGGFVERVSRRGAGVITGEYRLHVQCAWRIISRRRIVVGYSDMADPPDGSSSAGFDPNSSPTNRRDVLLAEFIAKRSSDPRVIVAVEGSPSGDARFTFDDGSSLEVLPDSTGPEDEYWRLILPDGAHIVMSADGLEMLPGARKSPPDAGPQA